VELSAELEGVVLLDADENRVTSSYDDVALLPTKLVKYLTKQLKTRESFLLGDTVSRAFFNVLVSLIGSIISISTCLPCDAVQCKARSCYRMSSVRL